jgi:hypothetical protein
MNRASPKSPFQGVWAVQRAGPIRLEEMVSIRRLDAVSSSKFSIKTGRSSQEELEVEELELSSAIVSVAETTKSMTVAKIPNNGPFIGNSHCKRCVIGEP